LRAGFQRAFDGRLRQIVRVRAIAGQPVGETAQARQHGGETLIECALWCAQILFLPSCRMKRRSGDV
jgi:hypothetical protein